MLNDEVCQATEDTCSLLPEAPLHGAGSLLESCTPAAAAAVILKLVEAQ
jgi:hypothetical protein